MSLIEWKDSYSIGIPAVDYEHQTLILLINELHDDLVRQGANERTHQFFGELFARVSAHFALEEGMMRDLGYDEYQPHKEEHEILLDGIRDMMDLAEQQGSCEDQRLSKMLDTWFSGHFRSQDARLHSFLSQKKK